VGRWPRLVNRKKTDFVLAEKMSKVDYSKWDKLELSDDEEIEVHPNVDKRSFIRWKQASLHKERRERRDTIHALELETLLNEKMLAKLQVNTHVDKLGDTLGDNVGQLLEFAEKEQMATRKATMEHAFADRPEEWGPPMPSEIVSSALDYPVLLKQVKESSNAKQGLEKLKLDIEKRQAVIASALAKEIGIRDSKITSENIGNVVWDKSITNTTTVTPATSASSKPKTEQLVEEIHTPNQSTNSAAKSGANLDDEITPMDESLTQFSKLSIQESRAFISKHPEIVSSRASDALLGEALKVQMSGNDKYAKNLVSQSQLLSYIITLSLNGKVDGVGLFYNRMSQPGAQSIKGFQADVDALYNRVKDRATVLVKQEKEEEERAIQEAQEMVDLATQPDGSLAWPLDPSKEPTPEQLAKKRVFDSLSHELKMGLLIQDVDAINKALAALGDDAERVVDECGKVGLISLVDEDVE